VQRLDFARNYRHVSACLSLVEDDLFAPECCAPTMH
jgi:hypothetical protein